MRVSVGVRGLEISLVHYTEYLDEELGLHGHTYTIELYVEGEVGDRGYIVDLREVERVLREVLEFFDKKIVVPRDLDTGALPERLRDRILKNPYGNATIENIALDIAERVYERLRDRVRLLRLRLLEGSRYVVEIEIP